MAFLFDIYVRECHRFSSDEMEMLQGAQQNIVIIKGILCPIALILCQTKAQKKMGQSEKKAQMNAENLTTNSITKST